MIHLARQYFQAVAFEQGFRKHYDGFATDNIPGTTFDRTFHVEAFNFQGRVLGQYSLEVRTPCVVRLFFKGFRDVDQAIETATRAGEIYYRSCLEADRKLGAEIKNVFMDQMVVEPYAVSNDNYVVCRIEFTVLFIKAVC